MSPQIAKKKRRPAGTPDLDAEVVALSPRTLLEQDGRLACEICGRRFRREQNLQMHLRRHNAPWELRRKRGARAAAAPAKRRVYVCPEPGCRYHDPARALGDLAGIKKHFLRKHGGRRRWTCPRCARAYAVQTDYKAHVRTCGDRGGGYHACGGCGRVFSRAEVFDEHQRTCHAAHAGESSPARPGLGADASRQQMHAAVASPRVTSPFSAESSTDADAASAADVGAALQRFDSVVFSPLAPPDRPVVHDTAELQLMPPRGSCARGAAPASVRCCDMPAAAIPQLELSMWFGGERGVDGMASASAAASRVNAREQLRLATAESAAAEEARAQARREVELAEQELEIARRARQQAQVEFNIAHALRDHAVRQVRAAMLLQAACYSCRHQFSARAPTMSSEVASYVPSIVTEVDNDVHLPISTPVEDTPSHARMNISS